MAQKAARTKYWQICIDGQIYRAHRLAWFYVYGEWPKEHIDHIDGCGTNNRIDNLRDVTNQKNHTNTKVAKNNTSGVKGVCWYKPYSKWRARINVYGNEISLGYHETLEAAAAARAAAEIEHGYTTPEAQ
jgi:hypothetical protein